MKREYLLLFIIFSIFTLGNLALLCRGYYPLLFDNQILLSWQFWAEKGLIPYKDFYYQYGLLAFYKGHSFLYSSLYYFLSPVIFLSLFITVKRIFRNQLYSYTSIFTLFLFVIKFTGFEIFTRYGLLCAFVCLVAQFLYSNKKNVPVVNLILFGIVNGFIFPMVNDTGIYALASTIILICIDAVIRNVILTRSGFANLIYKLTIYICGFLVGIIPFIVYLVYNNSLVLFTNSLLEYPQLQQIAKIPFFHNFLTFDNLFTLSILFVTLSYLSYCFFAKVKFSLAAYIQIGLVVVLIILEQKSIWRHIDSQLTFIGLLLFVLMYKELTDRVKNIGFYVFLILCVSIMLSPFTVINVNSGPINCQNRFKINSKSHTSVVKYLQTKKDFNDKVFSFPGDTVFYLLLNQKPPYYPTIFEGSSLAGQKKLMDFIKDNKIRFVVYNYVNYSIQDGVPNYIRVPYLHSYILNNFYISNIVGDFLILKKGPGDFIMNNKLTDVKSFKDYLLNVDLANIPRSEGIYKGKYLSSSKKIVGGSEVHVNSYLKENDTSSNDKLLVIKSGVSRENIIINIQIKDGLNTSLSFKPCGEEVACIINLSNIPLFYKNRTLKSISSKKGSGIKSISIVKGFDHSIFW